MRIDLPLHTRRALALAATLLAMATTCLAAPPAHAAPIEQRVAAAVRESGLSTNSTVVVYRESDQLILYQHRPTARVTPASNEKLYTAAAALRAFGPDHRFQTRLALQGTQKGSTFTGTVYLIGGGDPTLSTSAFARRNLAGSGAKLELLTAPLRARGIKRVRGKVVVDDSYFDRQRYVRSWPSYFRYDETTALGALTVNQSYLGSGLWGRAARQPALRAGQVYLQLLHERGVHVSGGLAVGTAPPGATEVGLIESPPLRAIVAFMNRRSDNFTAEILLKQVGKVRRNVGSTRAGGLAARQLLAAAGLDVSELTIADGSGLSSSNRTSGRNVADLLNLMARDETLRGPWLDSLAVAGRSGTLVRRLRGFPYRGRVRGKTGTLRHTSALSGYAVRASTGKRYGFAVITYTGRQRVSYLAAHRLQDRIAAILVR